MNTKRPTLEPTHFQSRACRGPSAREAKGQKTKARQDLERDLLPGSSLAFHSSMNFAPAAMNQRKDPK